MPSSTSSDMTPKQDENNTEGGGPVTLDATQPTSTKSVEDGQTISTKNQESTDDQQEMGTTIRHKSHFQNDDHPAFVRYGIILFVIGTLVLLINADFASGVSAEFLLVRDGELIEQRSLLVVSIVSSVKELWQTGSYPLAILIALTSVGWPYINLVLSFLAWVLPYKNPERREFFVEIIDGLGKWAFVDIIVLVQIMVAFRSSILLAPSVSVEIVILAKWGFYGFVIATMLSHVLTHYILHRHRRIHYRPKQEEVDHRQEGPEVASGDDEKRHATAAEIKGMKGRDGITGTFIIGAGIAIFASFTCYLLGCLLEIYEITNTRGSTSFVDAYSLTSVGRAVPESALEPDGLGTRFIQTMWFIIGIVMPLLCSFLFGILYLCPLPFVWLQRVFVMAEIAFAWSCAEVLLVSVLFSILQMPKFGDGLVEANCTACFIIDTTILPQFSLMVIGAVSNVLVNVYLFRRAHRALYHST